MERALVHDRASSDDLTSAIMEFQPEAEPPAIAAGSTGKGLPSASGTGTPPSPSKPESFFSETLESFSSEPPPSPAAGGDGSRRRDTPEMFGEVLAAQSRSRSGVMIGAAALVILVAVAVPAGRWLLEPSVPLVPTGVLVIITNPPGATAVIDGTPGGTTPLNQEIAAGTHTVEFRGAGLLRTIAVTVPAGGQAFQYIELTGAASDVGQLNVRSEPSGAFVTIDGVARGTTPIVVDLAPGEHTVLLASDRGWIVQAVSIKSGVMGSMAVPATSWSVVAP